ncbi:MAG: AtpZ/AtpI family protein [Oscillospiraceae bacterium]|nr:AtpZ/AtpI family protein [Oscillospiraceae bacterium]
MSGKKSPFAAYAVASQLAFVILAPLLLFIVGGHYVCEYYDLPDWVMVVCILLGILFMVSGAISHIMKLIRIYGRDDKTKYRRYNSDPRDNDYDDDYNRRK